MVSERAFQRAFRRHRLLFATSAAVTIVCSSGQVRRVTTASRI
jgi:hypothetical protein